LESVAVPFPEAAITLTLSSGRVLYILYTVPWIVTCWPQAFPQARNVKDKVRTSNALWVEWAKSQYILRGDITTKSGNNGAGIVGLTFF
jgi:hypothetical protein